MAPTLLELTRKKYADQAKWYLNGFWKEGAKEEAEAVWNVAQKFVELDAQKKEGNELDEFWAHKFLETQGETLTVVDLRKKMAAIDQDFNKKMALLEYLLFRYSKGVKECCESPQDDNQKEIEEAQSKLQAVQDALAEVTAALERQTAALDEQKKAEASARDALQASTRAAIKAKGDATAAQKAESEAKLQLMNQKKAEEVVRAAEAELKAAVDALHLEEDTYRKQISDLEAKSNDASASTVQKSKSANELAQLKAKDSLPLQKAKITQTAALKKVEKERKSSEAVTAKAKESHDEAEKAARVAESSQHQAEEAAAAAEATAKKAAEMRAHMEEETRKVEAAAKETEDRMAEALAYLELQKSKSGVAHGSIWWMERELKEAQKYLPKKKQTLL
eukprot:TRINITY_DN415_c1_g1_i1.p1 TRINITY_DN415_c1_g1~~TRINITY_DN415_c1_g1_i1.p1  ORF type:complete len:393 (-),score=171.43 TRINITY_DN415_c1_g1_i1:94-1272(-)